MQTKYKTTDIQLSPFINEIVFQNESGKLRLIGSEFVLEKYRSSSVSSLFEVVKAKWQHPISDEWGKMSNIAKQMLVNGDPVKIPESIKARSYCSENTVAIVSFSNGSVRFWENRSGDFDYELRYGYRAYCKGGTTANEMECLKVLFQSIAELVNTNGRKLDVTECRETFDPQEDYMETGDENIIRIRRHE